MYTWRKKKYNLALEEYYKGLSYIDVSETKSLYYKFINNIAICYGNLNQPAKELEYYQKVLDVLKEIGSTDDYSDIYVNIASCYFSLGNYSQAIEYNKKALEYAKKAGQLVTQRIAYKSLVKSYIKSNEKEKALEALHNFVLIEDSISTSNSNREIQDIKIRYETEKKEAENKLLSQKNELGEAKIKSKNRLITGLVTGIVLVVILVLLLLTIARLRKNRNELKNILLVQQERERISRDLHDSVGGQLSYVLFSLEGISNKQEEEKLKNISSAVRNVIGDLRQTIWAMNEKNLSVQSLSDKLKVYARSLFNNTDVKIVFDECIEHDLFKSSTVMLSLFRACQEIINNAFKHSNCNELTIRILSNNNITIEIQDNGIGFDTQKETSETYGLLNIKARINEINGSVEVFSKDKGTYYKIIV
jgi:signal transduction histidine kinase